MVLQFSCKRDSKIYADYLGQLPLAKARLQSYPFLNKQFDNFKKYEDITYYESSKNYIFRVCIRKPRTFWTPFDSVTLLVDDPNFPSLLSELEDAINHFEIEKNWSIKQKNDFKNKLTSPDSHESFVAVSELLISYQIDKKIGPSKVSYQYTISSGRKPDIVLEIGNDRKLFIELTSLQSRKSEEKIEKICKDLADYLNNKCTGKNYTIIIHFDTATLIPFSNTEDGINESAANSFLYRSVDNLFLHELTSCEGKIDFLRSSGLDTGKYLIDVYRNEYGRISLPQELYKMITDQPIVAEWAQKVRIDDYLQSPLESVSFILGGDNECVIINSVDLNSNDPSALRRDMYKTAAVVKTAFKNQLRRTISYKTQSRQYEEGIPVIFGINAFEWRLMFEHDYDEFIELTKIIVEEVNKTPSISGIIIYYTSFENGRYIENSNADPMIRITQKELWDLGIIRKYNDPILTHDKKVDFESLSFDEQVKRIEQLIFMEPSLSLWEDKLEFLNNVELLLSHQNVPNDTLTKLQPIVKKYCNDPDPRNEIKVERSKQSVWLSSSLRATAAACQLRLTWHNPTQDNKNLCAEMFRDKHTYVRAEACQNLSFLSVADYPLSFSIAKKILNDNWIVRSHLIGFLRQIALKHREDALTLCKHVIKKFGKLEYDERAEQNALLKFVVEMVVVLSLCNEVQGYRDLLDELVGDESYNAEIKKEIAFRCKEDDILLNDGLHDNVIKIYTRLAEHKSEKVRNNAIFFLLYYLTKKEISFLPQLKSFLVMAASQKSECCGTSYRNFQILEYLDKFWKEMPEDTAILLITVYTNNPDVESYVSYSDHVVNLLKNLIFSNVVSNNTKLNLRSIAKSLRGVNPYFDSLLKDID